MANNPAVNTPLSTWPLGAVPAWQKWNIANSGANFLITAPDGSTSTVAKAAATTQSISLLVPGVKFVLANAAMKTATAFAGVTGLTATVGITGSLTGLLSVAYNLKTAVSATNFQIPTVIPAATSFNGTDAILLALTSAIENLSAINAGSVDVWVEIAYLP